MKPAQHRHLSKIDVDVYCIYVYISAVKVNALILEINLKHLTH